MIIKNIYLNKRTGINLTIWFGNVLLWGTVASFAFTEILPGWFWILFLLCYAVQSVPYLLFLKKYFKDRHNSNIVLVLTMPFIIFFGIWLYIGILGLLVASQLKT